MTEHPIAEMAAVLVQSGVALDHEPADEAIAVYTLMQARFRPVEIAANLTMAIVYARAFVRAHLRRPERVTA